MYFLTKQNGYSGRGIKYVDQTDAAYGGGVEKMLTWGGGVGQIRTLADKGGRGFGPLPPFLADIICEHPLI